MKNIFKFLPLLLISSLFLNSCGSFNKARYNNSYYIGMSSKEKVKDNSSKSDNETSTAEGQEFSEIEKNSPNYYGNAENTALTEEQLVDETAFVLEEQDNLESLETGEANESASNRIFQKSKRFERLSKAHSIIRNNFNNDEETINRGGGGDALSLLWIVIVVLLILWVLGWGLGGLGLGGLTHVLGVIALILLILWLLRVI